VRLSAFVSAHRIYGPKAPALKKKSSLALGGIKGSKEQMGHRSLSREKEKQRGREKRVLKSGLKKMRQKETQLSSLFHGKGNEAKGSSQTIAWIKTRKDVKARGERSIRGRRNDRRHVYSRHENGVLTVRK